MSSLHDNVTSAKCVIRARRGVSPEPVWLVGVEHPRLTLQAYGSVVEVAALEELAWLYAAGLLTIARNLDRPVPEETHVHLYLSAEIHQRVAPGYQPACIDFGTRAIHQMPWNTPGHEFAHLVAYDAFGGRSANRLWEEAVAECFTNPFGWPHRIVRDRMGKDSSREFVTLSLDRGEIATDSQRWIWGSFVCWLLEHAGPAPLARVWTRGGNPLAALGDILGRSPAELIEQWRAHVRHPDTPHRSHANRAGFQDDAYVLTQRLRRTIDRLSAAAPASADAALARPAPVTPTPIKEVAS